jgi:hypothetical protein
MKLRDHPDIDWPPANWSSSAGGPFPHRQKAVLEKCTLRGTSIELATNCAGARWSHTYSLADHQHLQNFYEVLKANCGKTMEEIGLYEINESFGGI